MEKSERTKQQIHFYFAASWKHCLLSFVSFLLFFAFTLILYAYSQNGGAIVCLLVSLLLLADVCNFVLVDEENITHICFLRVLEPKIVIPICGIQILSTSLEKNMPCIYIGGLYTHVTVKKDKKLWEELLRRMDIPAQDLEQFLTWKQGSYQKNYPNMTLKAQAVQIPQLFSTISFVTHEVTRQISEQDKERISEKRIKNGIKKFKKPVDRHKKT